MAFTWYCIILPAVVIVGASTALQTIVLKVLV